MTDQLNILNLQPDPTLAEQPLFPKTKPEPFQRPKQPDPHALAKTVASASPRLTLQSPRVGLVQTAQSSFAVIGFNDREKAESFMEYLFGHRLSTSHRVSTSQYLDAPFEVQVWGLSEQVLKGLVERDRKQSKPEQIGLFGKSDPILTREDRNQLLAKMGFVVVEDAEPDPPDETYRHWLITIGVPNGGILDVTIESPDGGRYGRPTFEDYEEDDWDGVMALGKRAIDVAIDGQPRNRFQIARQMAGLSRAQAAKILQINSETLQGWEIGYKQPSSKEVSVLADIYDVNILWLTGKVPERLAAARLPGERRIRRLR